MALIKCSECGKQISDKASFCPNCGVTNKSYTYCSNCGAKTVSDNFCNNCGMSINNYNTYAKSNKMCGIALAGGITSLVSLLIDIFGVVAIVAIVLSSIGLYKVNSNPGLRGKGWAICGIVCGICELIFKVLIIVSYYG